MGQLRYLLAFEDLIPVKVPNYPVADAERCHLGTDFFDEASNVAAEYAWILLNEDAVILHFPVYWIDGHGTAANNDFLRSWSLIGGFGDFQILARGWN